MKLQVYLDSSDYSVLSDPARANAQLMAIRDRLFNWAASGDVEFRFSAAHIVEMSPLKPAHSSAAKMRAEMLAALCGRKTLISFDKLIIAEINTLAGGNRNPIEGKRDFHPTFLFFSPGFRLGAP